MDKILTIYFSKNYESSDRGWVYQTKSVENKTWNICNSLKSEKMTSLVETNNQDWVYQTKSVEKKTWNICNFLNSEKMTSFVETDT